MAKQQQMSKRSYTVLFDTHADAKTSKAMFAALAAPLLLHPLGWTKFSQYAFTVVKQRPADIVVTLAPQAAMDAMFPDFKHERLSVCNMATRAIFINEARWLREYDDDKSELQLPAYRAYVIQHEVGHALGKQHERCGGAGKKTPVMLQQTKGTGGCTPYPFPSEA
jgi:hypothetical protein